jgi:hypothetical protein
LKTLPSQIGLLDFYIFKNIVYCFFSSKGDLIHLKRLYLESNFLKNLPYELGKLNLEDLGKNLIFKFSQTKKNDLFSIGLNNNPLGDHILSLFARPNGTYEVMNYLREKWNFICCYKISLPWNNTELDSNETNSNI